MCSSDLDAERRVGQAGRLGRQMDGGELIQAHGVVRDDVLGWNLGNTLARLGHGLLHLGDLIVNAGLTVGPVVGLVAANYLEVAHFR